MTYNPAGQIGLIAHSNDSYAWTAHSNVERDYASNGLNQYTTGGGAALGYDGRGNLTSSTSGSVTTTYSYNRLNLLTGSSNGAVTTQMTYDSSGRLVSYSAGGAVTQMAFAGANLAQERNAAGTLLRRYVFGPGTDNPVVWYEGSGTAGRRWLQGDERDSVVAVSDGAGAILGINRYDEYGIPQGGNVGRFQYTGQTWYGEVGLYNYKARWYSPTLGRFMQTDPIGYKDQINLYAYVGNDPVNKADPSGLAASSKKCEKPKDGEIQVCNSWGESELISPVLSALRVDKAEAAKSGTKKLYQPQSGQTHAAKMSEEEQEAAAEADDKICRIVKTRECWASAAERRAARVSGRPVPPLQTGVKGSWSGRDVAAGAGALVIIGGIICLIAEPCGAAVGGASVLGGGAVLLGN